MGSRASPHLLQGATGSLFLVQYITFPRVKVSLNYRPHANHCHFNMLERAFLRAVAGVGEVPDIER